MKSHLFLTSTGGLVDEIGHPHFDVQVLNRASPDHPERSEDSLGVWSFSDGSLVLAVADGMGGAPGGQAASRKAIETLDGVLGNESGDSLRSVILDAYESANRDVLALGLGSGTTLVVAALRESMFRTFNVGDSGALLVGQRGRIKAETTDHSPVGYGIAAGLIDAEAALEHEDRHFLSNYIGSAEMHIELGSARRCAARDTVLLASDGLFDNLSTTEVVETIRCGPLAERAALLEEQAVARMRAAAAGKGVGKPDDLSFILVRSRRS